jgi:hypothetical protein
MRVKGFDLNVLGEPPETYLQKADHQNHQDIRRDATCEGTVQVYKQHELGNDNTTIEYGLLPFFTRWLFKTSTRGRSAGISAWNE